MKIVTGNLLFLQRMLERLQNKQEINLNSILHRKPLGNFQFSTRSVRLKVMQLNEEYNFFIPSSDL